MTHKLFQKVTRERIILTLLRLVLWPNIQSILENSSCAKKNAYSAPDGWTIVWMILCSYYHIGDQHSLIPKPSKDTTKNQTEDQYPWWTYIRIVRKLLANRMQQHMKLLHIGFILEIHEWFNIYIQINVMHHINREKARNPMITSQIRKAFNKMQHPIHD